MNTVLKYIKVKPYDHQMQGAKFAIETFKTISKGAALLMEMGTGKTLTSILIILYLYLQGKVRTVLIVAPISILGVWANEFIEFVNMPIDITRLNGSVKNKQKQAFDLITKIESNDTNRLQIVLINYESSWRLEKEFLFLNPDMVICDEGHKLKDARSKQSMFMHKMGDIARFKLLLTGTVITNKEIDIFSQYRFLNSVIYGPSFYIFRSKYFRMGGYGLHTPIFIKEKSEEFLSKLHSIAYRIRKDECLDLPEVTEEVRPIDLENDAMDLYKEIDDTLCSKFDDGNEITVSNVLVKSLRLSQITGGFIPDDKRDIKCVSSAKMEALIDILDSAMQENKKIVVIARFKEEMDAIEDMLTIKKIKYSCIRGGVTNRDEQVRNFQNNDTCMVFLGQIATAGLGITLTASSTMVFYSMDYSMSNFDQCKARIHRAGQKENCHYIYLIAKNTVDEKVLYALRHKIDLAKMLVDDYRNRKKQKIGGINLSI